MEQKDMGHLPLAVVLVKTCNKRPALSKLRRTKTVDKYLKEGFDRTGMCLFGGMNRPWSELPIDILYQISKRLCSVDRFRFRAVCKNWRTVSGSPYADKLPWLMRYDRDNIVAWCKFVDPSYNQSYNALCGPTYTFENQCHEDERVNYRVLVHALTKGWLLLQSFKGLLFFYNPFKKEIIELPSLNMERFVATFIGMPNSSDCVVFVIEKSENRRIEIRTCHCGDSSWNAYNFNCDRSTLCTHVAYVGATFYCFFFRHWIVGAFDTVTKEWSLLSGVERALLGICMAHQTLMIETDGQLFLVHYPSKFLQNIPRPKHDRSSHHQERFYVEKLDFAEKKWCIVSCLENRIVFLNFFPHKSYHVLTAEGETRNMANRIYYNAFSCSWFYSMETQRHHLCSERIGNFPAADESSACEKLARLWIENPF